MVVLDFCVGNASPREPGRNSAGTEVRVALEKRSRWEGWLGAAQDRREGNLLTVPSHCGGVLVLLMEKVDCDQGHSQAQHSAGFWFQAHLPGPFLCPKTCYGFLDLLQYIKFHPFLQLHFEQFVFAVLDLSYTSISTQAQEVLCQAKLSSKKSVLSIVKISEGHISPSFLCS